MARLLIVDDDNMVRAMLQQMLERAGYDVIAAKNGVEAELICSQKKPNLVITDIVMPEKEGLELIRDLKLMFPDIKLIAISGGGRISSDDYLTIARGLGAIYTLKKPISQVELLNTIKELLN